MAGQITRRNEAAGVEMLVLIRKNERDEDAGIYHEFHRRLSSSERTADLPRDLPRMESKNGCSREIHEASSSAETFPRAGRGGSGESRAMRLPLRSR